MKRKMLSLPSLLILIITHQEITETDYEPPGLEDLKNLGIEQIDMDAMAADLSRLSRRFTKNLIEQSFAEPLPIVDSDAPSNTIIEVIITASVPESERALRLLEKFRDGSIIVGSYSEQRMLRYLARLMYRKDASRPQYFLFKKEFDALVQ